MNDNNYSSLSANERLKAARKLKDWPQKKLAESLAIKQSNLSDIESGRRTLSNKLLDKACVVLNVSRDWMLTGKGNVFTQSDGSDGADFAQEKGFDFGGFVDAVIAYSDERRPTRHAKNLNDKEVDFELSYAIEQLKDIYTDNRLLTDSLPTLGATERVLEKFPALLEFPDWHKGILENFMDDHAHLSGKELKILKVEELYHPEIEHWRKMLSKLIFYIYQYGKLFRDKHRPQIEI